MPNKKGGKKRKRGKKNRSQTTTKRRRLTYAKDGQLYAKVMKKVGCNRLQVLCSDGKNRSAVIPGRMRKRVWLSEGDILLCDDIGGGSCWIIDRYTDHEIVTLQGEQLINFDPVNKTGGTIKWTDDSALCDDLTEGKMIDPVMTMSTIDFEDL